MRQRIRNQRETKPSEHAATAVFHGGGFLGGRELFRARPIVVLPLTYVLQMSFSASAKLSLVSAVSAFVRIGFLPHRRRVRPLSDAKTFRADGPTVCSALALAATNFNKRGSQAVVTVTTTLTEQRRCFAA